MSAHSSRPWYIVDPRSARFIGPWDGVTSVALLFTAIFTPYEVGFLPPSRRADEPLFILNRLIDVIFMLDFTLQFFLMYLSNTGARDGKAASWVNEPRKIAWHYVTSPWFPLDVLSIGVATFDYLELDVVKRAMSDSEESGAPSTTATVRSSSAATRARLAAPRGTGTGASPAVSSSAFWSVALSRTACSLSSKSWLSFVRSWGMAAATRRPFT